MTSVLAPLPITGPIDVIVDRGHGKPTPPTVVAPPLQFAQPSIQVALPTRLSVILLELRCLAGGHAASRHGLHEDGLRSCLRCGRDLRG